MPRPTTPVRQAARGALAFAAALLFCALAPPPDARAQREAPASVAGRVTDGERPMPGITVTLVSTEPGQRFRTAARARTDAEGRFLLQNVPPGRYQILPVAPAHVVAGLWTNYPPGRPLTLVAGEEVRDIDFKVEPGGVITGRVTDADGNPVVGEAVTAAPAEENQGPPRLNFDQRDQMTDDRGVYRLFGLPPGRYRVSVGRAVESGALSYGRRKLFRRTFYPDAVEQAQARVVEVKSGSEASDVDITVGRALKTYKVSGRFVMADTGQPVANVAVGFTTLDANGRRRGGFGSDQVSNARGEFTVDGLAPGRYAAYASVNYPRPVTAPTTATEFFGDPVTFEVTDADVSGLVLRLKRGATVTGVVTVEGVTDRAAVAQMLSAVRVYAWVEPSRQQVAPSNSMRPSGVNPDGTFHLTGLQPGKARLGIMSDTVKGLTTTRIELNGVNVIRGFDVTEGAQLANLRVVLTYGTGTLVGQTTFVNGAVPAGARVMADARLVNPAQGATVARAAEVDARGFFRIEGLPAGEYEVVVRVFHFGGGGGGARSHRSEPHRVVIADGGEARIAPVIDLK